MRVKSWCVGVFFLLFFPKAALSQEDCLESSEFSLITQTGSYAYRLDIADHPSARERGLMFRHHLKADRGMLFLFDPPQRVAMWMKNTPLSLDVIFIDSHGRVFKILPHTIPYSLTTLFSGSTTMARGVVELKAGQAQKIGLQPGDLLRPFPFESSSHAP